MKDADGKMLANRFFSLEKMAGKILRIHGEFL